MGRPLNKRYFGATSTDIASSPPGDISNEEKLTAIVKVGANSVSETGIILSQRSETKFKVDDAADGSGNEGVCTLVDKDVPGNDEMVLKGYVAGSGDGVNIRKVQNRTMLDFDNNRYTWEIQDDSTSNVLVLTAI
jgi:PKD repeat protein